MITFKEYLIEKLDVLNPNDPSYRFLRNVYKTWDKERYKKLFDDFKDWGFLDKRSTRLYYPLSKKKTVTPPNNDVVSFLKSKGYDIIDYSRGILQKSDSKGKLVTSSIIAVLSKYKQKELESIYAKDPHRADVKANESTSDDYLIVISRHPYDIIGMTSGRSWGSCVNLERGRFKDCVEVDVKEGSLVAYLIKATDKDIQEPIGRLTIRPYLADVKEIVLGVSTKGYYEGSLDQATKDLFYKRVSEWVEAVHEKQELNGIFELTPGLYKAESKSHIILRSDIKNIDDLPLDEQIKLITKNPNALKLFYRKVPDEVLIAAVGQDYELIFYIFDEINQNVSNAVILRAINESRRNGDYASVLEYVFEFLPINRVSDILVDVINNDPSVIDDILNGSIENWSRSFFTDEVLLMCISKGTNACESVLDSGLMLSEKVQLALVEKRSSYIRQLYDNGLSPSVEVQFVAVEDDAKLINVIMENEGTIPDPRVQIAAIKNDIDAIEYIEDFGYEVSAKVRKAAGVD